MPGILDYRRYIELFYTVKDVIGHFPLEQTTLNYSFDNLGTQGWTGSMSWQTLIIDQFRYRFGEPYFDNSNVIGYFPADSKTFAVTGQLQLPAYMYTGTIIPESYSNVPITVVEFEFQRGLERFSKQLLLIENWHPGIAIGDPRLHPNYTPVDGLPSTLTLTSDVTEIMQGDNLTLTATTDITEQLSPIAAAKFYVKTGPTSQTLLGSAAMVGTTSSFTFATTSISTGSAVFFATFNGGNPRYGFVQSNTLTVNLTAGNPLQIQFSANPSTANPGQTVISIASATVSTTSSQYITNTTTFTVQARLPNSGEIQNPVTQTGQFMQGSTSTQFTVTNSYVPTNINSATYTVNSVTSDGITATFNTTINKIYDLRLSWGSLFSQKIRAGSTATTLTVTTTQNITQALEPVSVNVVDTQQNQTTNLIYNNTAITLRAVSNVGRNQGLTATAVVFEADYTPNYQVQNYTVARTPVITVPSSTGNLRMPLYLNRNQVLLRDPQAVRVGATLRFPGTPDTIPAQPNEAGAYLVAPGQWVKNVGPRNTGTYTVTAITSITTGVNSGTVLATLNRNWDTSPYSSLYQIPVSGQLSALNETQYEKAWSVWSAPTGYSGFSGLDAYSWAWCSIWTDNENGSKWILSRQILSVQTTDATDNRSLLIGGAPPNLGVLGASERQLKELGQGSYRGYQTGYWTHLVWSVDLNRRGQRGFASDPTGYFPGDNSVRDWRNVLDTPQGGSFSPRSISPNFSRQAITEPFPIQDRAEQRIENTVFTYNRYQDVLVGLFTASSTTRNITLTPTNINSLTTAPRADLYPLPVSGDPNSVYSVNWATVATYISPYQYYTIPTISQAVNNYTWRVNKLVPITDYTTDDQGNLVEKDRLFFTSLGTIATGTTFTFTGLINTGTTSTVYTVFEFGNNYLRADPPWNNHIATDYGVLNGATLQFSNPVNEDLANFRVTQITELKYVGLGVPYYTGAYTFNRVKFADNSQITVNTTFKMQGGPRSPIGTVFTVVAEPDAQGFWTISPAYSITSYTETEQWRRDNETFTNFQNFERNRNIVFFASPFESSTIRVRGTTGTNTLILENIPSNLQISATFNSTLTNFAGTYTVTSVDPFRERIVISPAWSSTQTAFLSQWTGKSFAFTNPILTTSTVILGTATNVVTATNFDTTWTRTATLNPGTYNVRARLTPQFETGAQAPFRYATTSTTLWNLQSSPGLIAPLDIETRSINVQQSQIRLVCRGSTAVDPANYYVFDTPVEFYNNGQFISTGTWSRTSGALEQVATATVFTSQIGTLEARWPGSMNYVRTSPDQILFQPSTLIL